MRIACFACITMMLCTGCLRELRVFGPDSENDDPFQNQDQTSWQTITQATSVTRYDDVRFKDLRPVESSLDTQMVATLWFHQKTIWPQRFSGVASVVLEKGRNPGLGIRGLHDKGITGKNVTVAVIDQNLCRALDHPEYKGKIISYHDVGCNQTYASGSMHAPAVTSLLVGTTIGTAPDARVYFAAAPSWTADAKYQADALNWVIDENAKLPADSKIRVVSISAAPSGPGSPFSNNALWDAAYDRARSAGILVLDCTKNHGLTAPCYYDLDDPDNMDKITLGYPNFDYEIDTARLCIPNSRRTQAEEYSEADTGYQYTGEGGLSWTCPYLAGVLAMGWQMRPELTDSVLTMLLFRSAFVKDGKYKIVNPVAFIDSVVGYSGQ
jgi:serine protease AprX